jgi:hypothetical protein
MSSVTREEVELKITDETRLVAELAMHLYMLGRSSERFDPVQCIRQARHILQCAVADTEQQVEERIAAAIRFRREGR